MPFLIASLVFLLLSTAALAQPPAHAPAHGVRGDGGPMHWQGRPEVDPNAVRQIFGRHDPVRGDRLPPGIRKNLERGKPLPPGIAKRLEGPLVRELPYYPGYDWNLAGDDAYLIDSATRVIVDIIENVFQ